MLMGKQAASSAQNVDLILANYDGQQSNALKKRLFAANTTSPAETELLQLSPDILKIGDR